MAAPEKASPSPLPCHSARGLQNQPQTQAERGHLRPTPGQQHKKRNRGPRPLPRRQLQGSVEVQQAWLQAAPGPSPSSDRPGQGSSPAGAREEDGPDTWTASTATARDTDGTLAPRAAAPALTDSECPPHTGARAQHTPHNWHTQTHTCTHHKHKDTTETEDFCAQKAKRFPGAGEGP